MKSIPLITSIIISIALIGVALILINNKPEVLGDNQSVVVFEDGIQVINVKATSNGYFPQKIEAKANTPTTLRMESENSYGCERSFRIPSLNIIEVLPQEGSTDIDLGSPEKGENILGSCSMGMYTFTITFK